MTTELYTTEAQRELIRAWLTANGIPLKGIPLREPIVTITVDGRRLIRYGTHVHVRGDLMIGVREVHEVPLTVELADVVLPEPTSSADGGGNSE